MTDEEAKDLMASEEALRCHAELLSLNAKISDLTWQGKFWGVGGALDLEREREVYIRSILYKSGRPIADYYGAVSSTYYAAAGNAWAEMHRSPFIKKPLWAVRAFWCLRCMAYRYSNECVKFSGGIGNLTASEPFSNQ